MKVQILGSGCKKCTRLFEEAEKVLKDLQISYEIEKITDMQQIISFGVMRTPAIVVDGIVKQSGRSLSQEELKKIFLEKK